METINLNQLTRGESDTYLLGELPFSGFAIETFPDGNLATQMALMHGRQDGVTRRWHSNGQLESEKSFRNGQPHGRHREWRVEGTLNAESSWNAGACIHSSRGDGVAAKPLSTLPHNCVIHYGYDFQSRQNYVKIEEVRYRPEDPPYSITYADSEPQPPEGNDSPAGT
jgi:hypothetical protein